MLAVITDKKLPKDITSDGTTDYFVADEKTSSDYNPFGTQLDGRKFEKSPTKKQQIQNDGKQLNFER